MSDTCMMVVQGHEFRRPNCIDEVMDHADCVGNMAASMVAMLNFLFATRAEVGVF